MTVQRVLSNRVPLCNFAVCRGITGKQLIDFVSVRASANRANPRHGCPRCRKWPPECPAVVPRKSRSPFMGMPIRSIEAGLNRKRWVAIRFSPSVSKRPSPATERLLGLRFCASSLPHASLLTPISSLVPSHGFIRPCCLRSGCWFLFLLCSNRCRSFFKILPGEKFLCPGVPGWDPFRKHSFACSAKGGGSRRAVERDC